MKELFSNVITFLSSSLLSCRHHPFLVVVPSSLLFLSSHCHPLVPWSPPHDQWLVGVVVGAVVVVVAVPLSSSSSSSSCPRHCRPLVVPVVVPAAIPCRHVVVLLLSLLLSICRKGIQPQGGLTPCGCAITGVTSVTGSHRY